MEDDAEMNAGIGTMVTALAWVSKGFAKPLLDSHQLAAKQMTKQQKIAGKLSKGKELGQAVKEAEAVIEDMDLDSEENSDDADDVPTFTPELAALKAKELGQDDEDMGENDDEDQDAPEGMDDDDDIDGPEKNKDKYPEAFSDSEEEKDDYTIRKSDSIIVAATAENDHSNLEIYVYEHEVGNLYVHHEIILSSYPLCIEWLPIW